jgi:glycosyltransferase involved in cell wall biosynthesis
VCPKASVKTYWKGFEVAEYFTAMEAASIISVQFDSFRQIFPEHVRERIVVLPNPIEIPKPAKQVRQQTIICVARIWFLQKRQDLLLRAFARAAARRPGWQLKFFGNSYGINRRYLRLQKNADRKTAPVGVASG